MGNAIAKRKPAIARKGTVTTREEIKRLASQHSEVAIKRLRELADNKSGKVPANAQVQALNALLDRSAGKPRFQDEKETEAHQLDKMTQAEILDLICQNVAYFSSEAKGAIAQALIGDYAIDPDFNEDEALRRESEPQGLPPLTPAKPRREPRR